MILSQVNDMKTYNARTMVARNFYDICLKRDLIMDDYVFRNTPPRVWDDNEEGEDLKIDAPKCATIERGEKNREKLAERLVKEFGSTYWGSTPGISFRITLESNVLF
ncbi:MAG: hypothetical protein Q9169_005528 [Polycauliona sp. 2 TL-2023]